MIKESIYVDNRMKSKIAELMDCSIGDVEAYTVRFTDLEDAFWFGNKVELQEFIRKQEVERFYDKELRKGYFDYVNEHNETLRYHVTSNRGKFTLIKEECLGKKD